MGQNKHSRPGVRHTPPARLPSDTIFLGVRATAISSTSSFLLTQPSCGVRGGGLPIVGFLNCGPTCKANSNARPQTDLCFARILSVWVGQWGRVRAISRMRWSCAERATASRPRTFFFANTYLFFIIDFLVHGNTSPKF